MANEPHNVLIVIPCLNEEAHLDKLVQHLIQTSGIQNFKIVIADGGSSDKSQHIAKELEAEYNNVVLLDNPKKLQASGVNLAVQQFGDNAEFLIRIDAHAAYPMNYCKILIDEAHANEADAVVVAMETSGSTSFQKGVAAAQNSLLGTGGSAHRLHEDEGRWIDHGHHALMRMEAFKAVGGYDETFACNEDAELDHRLGLKGYKIWLTAKTSVLYFARSMPATLFRQYMGYGYGRAETILKHNMHPKLRQLAPAAIMPIIVLALLSPVLHGMAMPLLLWLALCLGYGGWIAYRGHNLTLAYAGPAAILMHSGWSLGFWKAVIAELKGTR